jgi:hypothetical protein
MENGGNYMTKAPAELVKQGSLNFGETGMRII